MMIVGAPPAITAAQSSVEDAETVAMYEAILVHMQELRPDGGPLIWPEDARAEPSRPPPLTSEQPARSAPCVLLIGEHMAASLGPLLSDRGLVVEPCREFCRVTEPNQLRVEFGTPEPAAGGTMSVPVVVGGTYVSDPGPSLPGGGAWVRWMKYTLQPFGRGWAVSKRVVTSMS